MHSSHTSGYLLRRLRISHELTQKQLGDRLGITQAHLSSLETNKKQLTQELIERIAAVFSLSLQQQEQLLIAAGFQEMEDPSHHYPALGKLYHFLEDTEIPIIIKQLLEEQLEALHYSWTSTAEVCINLNKREWRTILTDTEQVLRNSKQLTSLLPVYLRELQIDSLVHQGNSTDAQLLLEENSKQISLITNTDVLAMHQLHWGDLLRDLGHWNQAEQHYFSAKSLYEQQGYDLKARQVDRKIAVIHLFRGDWNAARPILESCQPLFIQENLHNDLVRLKYALAWVYNLSGNWKLALEYHQEGLRLSYTHAEESISFQYLVMLGHSYLGNDYRQVGEISKALAEYQKANALASEFPQDREYGWILIGLARVAAMRAEELAALRNIAGSAQQYQAAIEYFSQALEVHRKCKFTYRMVMTQVHYARFLLNEQETIEKAEHLLTDALTLANSIHSVYYAAQIKSVLCELYRKQRRFEVIAHYVQEVEELAGQYHFYRILARLKATLAGAAVDQGHLRDAPLLFAQAFHFAILFNSETCKEIERIFVHHLTNLIEPARQRDNINLFGRDDAQSLCDNTALSLEQEFEKPKFYDSPRKNEAQRLVRQIISYSKRVKNREPLYS